MEQNIFFTSDTHFCHKQGFLYEPRGFSSIEEMNEAIVENWNKVIKPDDIVYDLGDIALNDVQTAAKYIKKLNGKHFWIRGNHDTDNKVSYLMDNCWEKLYYYGWADILKYSKYHFYLSHYPAITANYDDKKFSQHVISLHGHVHAKNNWIIPTNPFMYHVGMDSHNCTPVHIDEIIADIRNRYNQFEHLYEKYKEDTYGEIK